MRFLLYRTTLKDASLRDYLYILNHLNNYEIIVDLLKMVFIVHHSCNSMFFQRMNKNNLTELSEQTKLNDLYELKTFALGPKFIESRL